MPDKTQSRRDERLLVAAALIELQIWTYKAINAVLSFITSKLFSRPV